MRISGDLKSAKMISGFVLSGYVSSAFGINGVRGEADRRVIRPAACLSSAGGRGRRHPDLRLLPGFCHRKFLPHQIDGGDADFLRSDDAQTEGGSVAAAEVAERDRALFARFHA